MIGCAVFLGIGTIAMIAGMNSKSGTEGHAEDTNATTTNSSEALETKAQEKRAEMAGIAFA